MKNGFSVLEVIIAVAVFMIFSTGAILTVAQSYNANRLGEENTVATQFAAEGIEAVKSIKDRSFSGLTNFNSVGLQRNTPGNYWEFKTEGSNNILEKYTRTIKVENVNRDGSGNIVASGGTPDADTKKVTSTVTWNFNTARPETTSLITYLSDWRKPLAVSGDAIMLYGETGSVAQPKYRMFTVASNSFSAQNNAGTFTDTLVGKVFKLKTSPTKQEAIAGYVNNSGILRILCFDGSSWSSEWTQSVGGTGTNDQRFGIAYEKTTGNAMVVYSNNGASGANELGYRTKPGSSGCGSGNWSAHNNLDAQRITGSVQWIRTEGSPASGSNNIALVFADSNSDLSALIWNGSAFGSEPAAALETNLERVGSTPDVPSFDLAYESVTGNLMVVWGLYQASTCVGGTTIATSNCIRYARFTGSWSAVAVVPTVSDPATAIDIAANPNSNEMRFGALSKTTGDLSTAYWSGSTWTGTQNVDTSAHCVGAGEKLVASGWLINGAQTRSIVVYSDANSTNCSTTSTNVSWFVMSGGGAPSGQTDFNPTPAFAAHQSWYDIQTDPKNLSQLMLSVSDANSDLFAKRLIMSSTGTFTAPNGWSNSDGSAALELNLGQATAHSYGFAYWRNP